MARHSPAYALHERCEQVSKGTSSVTAIQADLYAYDGNIDCWRDEDGVDDSRMLPGWWIIPGALLGAAFWYFIFRAVWALFG